MAATKSGGSAPKWSGGMLGKEWEEGRSGTRTHFAAWFSPMPGA